MSEGLINLAKYVIENDLLFNIRPCGTAICLICFKTSKKGVDHVEHCPECPIPQARGDLKDGS